MCEGAMPGPVFLFPLCFKEGRGGQIEGSWEFGDNTGLVHGAPASGITM